ncbi:MAG: DegT/DnrJ/EryC1/StrS family aminotransferase [Spirochaetaceae bacterium]|nr:DegT/DnrJ/EryC1/StrS family aminotransferase [Spirochaetaceae bacterium]
MNRVPVFRPTVRRAGMDSVLGCLVTDEIGPGDRARELAATVARALGMAGGIALADYRMALSCALTTIDVPAGSRVLCSALAPLAHRGAVEASGLVPVVVDVSAESGVMDLDAADEARGGARAALLDHTLGFIPDLTRVGTWDLPVIEDVTCSLGGYDGDAAPGPRADLVVVSLAETALLTAAGGALLLCRTNALLASAREAAADRAEPLADLNAALALAQLKRYDGDMQTRRTIRDAYHAAITRTRHRTLSLPHGADENLQVPFSYPVVVADGAREVQRYAARARIDTRQAYGGSIVAGGGATNGAAVDVPDGAPGEVHPAGACPAADSLARRCVLFPLYPLLGDGQVEVIAKILATLP